MLNILEFLFLNLAFMVSFTGFLINNFEKYVPTFIIKGYKYGSFAYRGSNANFLQIIEIPKSYYRHFYVFSAAFSSLALVYMYMVYYLGYHVSYYLSFVLKLFMETDQPAISGLSAFIAMSLLTVQCIRRLYETYFLQVFAKTSKMNLSHYVAGLLHYFGCVIAIIGQAPLFCGNPPKQSMVWSKTQFTFLYVPCILAFMWAWYEQYQANIIFANLRKDRKSGKLITEDHGIPEGRLFNSISSPHRMCELLMYTVLLLLVPTRTFVCIYLWVLGNQIQTAIQAHAWYKQTFDKYPKNRWAMIPKIL